jgi:hypothetical protein
MGKGEAPAPGDRASLPQHMYTLLGWRLTSLGLNPKAIERQSPAKFAELHAQCALCADKQKCLEGIMDYGIPRGWEHYCPNAEVIHLLCAGLSDSQAWVAPIGDCRRGC